MTENTCRLMGVALCVIGAFFPATGALAWTSPTSTPPNGNVSAPINVGGTAQTKSGALGVGGLGVFGDTLLPGSGSQYTYLNFGTTSGSVGYGIRNNSGSLEFKNSGDTQWNSLQSIMFNYIGGQTWAYAPNGSDIYSKNTGNVGIGTTNPASILTILTSGVSDDADNVALVDFENTASPAFVSFRARGTAAAPLPTQAGDSIGNFGAASYTGSGWASLGAGMGIYAETNATPTSFPTGITFYTTPPYYTSGAGRERMRITGGGNVGIGTTNPVSPLTVQTSGETNELANDVAIFDYTNTSISPAFAQWRARGTSATPLPVQAGDAIASFAGMSYNGTTWNSPNVAAANIMYLAETNATPSSFPAAMVFMTTNSNQPSGASERMRITGSGVVGINTQNPSANGLGFTGWGDPRLGIYLNGNDGIDIRNDQSSNFINLWHNGGGAVSYLTFNSGSGAPWGVGSITTNGSMTYYNTTSDRRLKENIHDTSLGLAQLMHIPVRNFDFIKDPKHATVTGFIAQELRDIYPDAVTTNGDNGTAPLGASATPWSVDYGRVTPLIVKAVQDIASLSSPFKQTLIAWLGSAQNGVVSLYADNVHTQQVQTSELDLRKICVSRSNGSKICFTGDQLADLFAQSATCSTK